MEHKSFVWLTVADASKISVSMRLAARGGKALPLKHLLDRVAMGFVAYDAQTSFALVLGDPSL